jgi:hypothetical protein
LNGWAHATFVCIPLAKCSNLAFLAIFFFEKQESSDQNISFFQKELQTMKNIAPTKKSLVKTWNFFGN